MKYIIKQLKAEKHSLTHTKQGYLTKGFVVRKRCSAECLLCRWRFLTEAASPIGDARSAKVVGNSYIVYVDNIGLLSKHLKVEPSIG